MIANCPSQESLKSLSLGQLPEEQSDVLLSHLQTCESCQQEIGKLDSIEDTFIGRLKSAAGDTPDEYAVENDCRNATARALAALATLETGAMTPASFPKKIGEYEIVEPLGQGGMGHVFLGRHTKLGRQVAIKFIASHRRWDQTMHQRFASEMRTIGSLNHPNIVAAHDAREVDGVAVLVTELIEGLNLSEIIKRHGPLNVSDACAIVIEVCRALSYIDSQGLVHRDIKPSNIMIDDRGTVKLLDLGLARVQASEGDIADFTATGQAIGTADYVAPEQINDGRNVDIRTDIYGLGCTLYKLLSGRGPFATAQYATAFAKMNAHVSQTPEPLSDLRSDLPSKLEQCVQAMLAKTPADRPQSVDHIVEQLQPFAESADLQELVKKSKALSPQEPTQPLPTSADNQIAHPKPQRLWRRRVPTLVAVGAALAGILLGVMITIKKPDGTEVTIQAPSGSTVVIDDQGNAEVQMIPKADGSHESTASPAPQTMKEVTVPVDQAFIDAYKPGALFNLYAESQQLSAAQFPLVAILKPIRVTDSSTALMTLNETEFARYETAQLAEANLQLETNSVGNFIEFEHRKMNGIWKPKNDDLSDQAILIFDDQVIVFSNAGPVHTTIERSRLKRTVTAVLPIGGKTTVYKSYRFKDDQQQLVTSFDFKDDQHSLELVSADQSASANLTLQKLKTPNSLWQRQAFAVQETLEQAPIRFEIYAANPASHAGAKEGGAKKIDLEGVDEQFWTNPKPFATNRDIVLTRVIDDMQGEEPVLKLSMPYERGNRLESLSIGSKMVFKIDGKVVFAPTMKDLSKIDLTTEPFLNQQADRFFIKGGFSKAELEKFRAQIVPRIEVPNWNWVRSEYVLRLLSQACLNYEADHGHFPASKNLHKESGKWHSWRVAILPYLDQQQELYDQYRLNEDWDSPHNSKLLNRMPPHFRHPSADRNSTTTTYVGFADDKTAFGIEKGHRLQDFKDGISNTLLLIEADSQIPWTKPEDLPLNDQTLESLKRLEQSGYVFSKADGSTHTVRNDAMPPAKLQALLTRSGGEAPIGR